MRGLLIAVVSLAAEHGLYVVVASVVAASVVVAWASIVAACGLQSTGSITVADRRSCSMSCGNFPDQGSNQCLPH